MGRSRGNSIGVGAFLGLVVASGLVGAASLGGPADEPASKKSEGPAPEPKLVERRAQAKDDALKVAEPYLVLLDRGKYAESWQASASEFRAGITRARWVEALNQTRRPFGPLQKRKLSKIDLVATGDPERYTHAWIYSDLEFPNGVVTCELVTVFFERGRDWKVSAYYIGDADTLPKPESVKVVRAEATPKGKTSKTAKKPATPKADPD